MKQPARPDTLRRSCREMMTRTRFCRRAALRRSPRRLVERLHRRHRPFPPTSMTRQRSLLDSHYVPFRVEDPTRPQGLFTGYYRGDRPRQSPPPRSLIGSRSTASPDDLVALDAAAESRLGTRYGRYVAGHAHRYFSRAEIEAGVTGRPRLGAALGRFAGRCLLHPHPGLGTGLDGRRQHRPSGLCGQERAGLHRHRRGAPSAGRPGLATIWFYAVPARLARPPPADAPEVLRQNESFIFFREVELLRSGARTARRPAGPADATLAPSRSTAPGGPLGTPVWLDSAVIMPGRPDRPFRMLLVAQDTGSAILGAARGDVFFGAGDEAAVLPVT